MNYIKQIAVSALLIFIFVSNLFSQQSGIILDEQSRNKFDFYYYEALNAKVLNKYAEAFDYLQHCMAIDSTNASVLVEIGAFYSSLGQSEQGLEYINKALAYDPANYYYNMISAGLNNQFGNKQEVIDIYNYLLKEYPAKVELYMELSNAYSNNEQYDEAIQSMDSLQKYSGDNPGIAFNKFRLYNMMDQKDKAFSVIQDMVDKSPNNIRYKLLIGDLYLQDGQFEKAESFYDQARSIDAEEPGLILSMVNYYEKTGKKEESAAEIERAIANPKMDIEEKMQLLTKYVSVLRQNKQDISKSNILFHQLQEQHPNNSEISLLYGEVLLLQEDKEGALAQFESFKNENPDNPAGYGKMIEIALSDTTYSAETLDKLIEITDEGISHIPTSPEFYFYNAMAKLQQDKLIEGMTVLQQGLANAEFQSPLIESDFYGHIGDVHHMLKDDAKAFEYYEKAIEINPQNLHVLNNYSYYLSLQKLDLDKAEKMSGLTVKAEPTNPTYLDTYAWILFEQEAYVMAKIYIEKAIEYGKDEASSEVYEHYGDILALSGDMDKAIEQWTKAKELGGNSKVLKKKIKRKKYYKK